MSGDRDTALDSDGKPEAEVDPLDQFTALMIDVVSLIMSRPTPEERTVYFKLAIQMLSKVPP